MTVLELERVAKRLRRGARQHEVLRDVSLQLHERELVAIWGPRGSGRSTLLRIAAAIEAPDSGEVRFRGRRLAVGRSVVAGGIAYCQPVFRGLDGQLVLDELIAAQLALGFRAAGARERALAALERAGARGCEGQRPFELDRAEVVCVGIARALLQYPTALIVDEPTTAVDILRRDEILQVLRSLSREGMAVLISVDKGTSLVAADRALALGEGELRGHVSPELASVVKLPLHASA